MQKRVLLTFNVKSINPLTLLLTLQQYFIAISIYVCLDLFLFILTFCSESIHKIMISSFCFKVFVYTLEWKCKQIRVGTLDFIKSQRTVHKMYYFIESVYSRPLGVDKAEFVNVTLKYFIQYKMHKCGTNINSIKYSL